MPLIVVCGPTATGKSALAVELCHEIDGEVVSADSMQIYRGRDIGTAKPTEAQRKGIPHHMIDVAEPWEDYSVARYCAEAKKAIRDIAERGKTPVLTGGTGLYIHSLIDHRVFMEGAEDRAYRADLRREACEFGPAHMHEKLRGMDPAAAKRIHPNNLVRVIRAIEIIELTGMTLEEYNRRGREGQSEYNLCMIGLTVEDRGFLYDRIDARVNRMVETD